jgi:hypothetical protein
MGHFELDLPCPVPAADAWAAVADVAALDAWWPGVEVCTVAGDRRSCTVTGNVTIEEEIRSIDADRRRLEYGIVAAPMPIEMHRAVVEVLDGSTADGSVLRFTVDVEPEEVATMMLPGLTPAFESLRDFAVRRSGTGADSR